MEKIGLKSINLGIHKYDRNPFVSELQYEVNKLKLNNTQSSGVVDNITVNVKQNDGSTKQETVNVGDLVKQVSNNTEDVKILKETTADGYVWNEFD